MKNNLLASLIVCLSLTATAQDNEGVDSGKKNHEDCLIVIGLKGLAGDLALDIKNDVGIDFDRSISLLAQLQYSNYHKMLNRLLSTKYLVSVENQKFIESIRRTYLVSALTPQYCGYRKEAPTQVWGCTRNQLQSIETALYDLQQRVCEIPTAVFSFLCSEKM